MERAFMNSLKTIVLASILIVGISSSAHAETAWLQSDDFVGMTYWLLSMGCLAATAFFFLERGAVDQRWRPAITVSGLITLVVFMHSMYMRSVWLTVGDAPIVFRYIEWLITMPLLMINFYFVLMAVRKVTPMVFWKLFFGTLIMVYGGYAGEAGYILPFLGFIIWMAGWIYILYELFSGEPGIIVSRSSNEDLVKTFGTMRMIVTVGWAIYPLGYVFGYLTGGIDSNSLNVIYNFADFINKIAFGLVIWIAATANTSGRR